MSNFKEFEKSASVYHANDVNTTKKTTYSVTADFTIDMFVIRRDAVEVAIGVDEIGDYVSNIDASYTNANNVRRSDKIEWDSRTYYVQNDPRYNNLFKQYQVILRKE